MTRQRYRTRCQLVKPSEDASHPLPRRRAFVVQFHASADVAAGRVVGRAEHVDSGEAMHFTALEELLTFTARWTGAERRSP
jgi:hypothetical protein